MKKHLVGILFLFIFLFFSFAYSETMQSDSSGTVLISIQTNAAQIMGSNDKAIAVYFSIQNNGSFLQDIKPVIVFQKQGTSEKIYAPTDLSFSLRKKDVFSKELTVPIPDSLDGNYLVSLYFGLSNGMQLSEISLGNLVFSSVLNYSLAQCNLTIPGDNNPLLLGGSYTLDQGVDVAVSEKLLLNCKIAGKGETTGVNTNFETFYRSLFGNSISKTSSKAGFSSSDKTISVEVPHNFSSQAYSAKFYLTNAEGKVISNEIQLHYVIQGLSATIQKVTPDKNYYLPNETAKINLFWTGPADSFYGARNPTRMNQILMNLSIKNLDETQCANPVTKEISKLGQNVELLVPIQTKCLNPKIAITFSDEMGNTLAQTESLPNGTQPATEPITQTGNGDQPIVPAQDSTILFLLAGILVIVIIAVLVMRYKKKVY